MKALWEIVRLQWRASVRSKAIALLTFASLAWMLILPQVLKGDGTESGAFELHVRYSFGVVFAVVLVALAASAAGSIAADRAGKRLQLTLVRPVRRFLVPLGRMFALTAVGFVVFALCALVLWFQVGRSRSCDHELAPKLAPPQEVAERMFQRNLEEYPDFKDLVAKQGKRDIMRYLVRTVMEAYQTVAPGETVSWDFDTGALRPDDEIAVRVRVTDMFGRLEHVGGTFKMGERTGTLEHVNKTLVRIPLTAGGQDGRLSFTNTGRMSVTICPRRDIVLLVRADSFAWNIVRVTLELTAVLALILAVALFFSACLGRSVAIFAVVSMLVVMVVSPTVVEEYPDPTEASSLDRVSLALTDFSARVTSPLNAYSPITALESGVCVERGELIRALAMNVVLLPVLLSLLAGFVMVRKIDGQ